MIQNSSRSWHCFSNKFSLSLFLSLSIHYIFTLSLPDPVGFISKVKRVASVLTVRIMLGVSTDIVGAQLDASACR